MNSRVSQPRSDDSALYDQLQAGRRAMRNIRCRVSGSLLVLGVSIGIAGQKGYSYGAWGEITWASGVTWIVTVICMVVLGMAPLRDDSRLTRVVIVANMLVVWTDMCTSLKSRANVTGKASDYFVGAIAIDCIFLFSLIVVLSGIGQKSYKIQDHMWLAFCFYFSLLVVYDLYGLLFSLLAGKAFKDAGMFLFGDIVGLSLSAWPGFRRNAHAWVAHWFDKHGRKAAAAGVAGLVGDCPVEEVHAQAKQRFHSISLTQLAREDVASSDPNPDLYARSAQTRLGECDVFISHSWSDDEGSKWAVLQRWHSAFLTEHRREPRVWLDKCCIDQSNIEVDLRCLPIFVSGCKEMVVLCGTTYLSRLWCILELFVHHHISWGKLTVVPVLREDNYDEDRRAVHEAAAKFDAGKCLCSRAEDKDKILTIILAAFGSTDAFNKVVSTVLTSNGLGDSSSSDEDTSTNESDSINGHRVIE